MHVLVMFINQVRHTTWGPLGGRMETTGGAALKYYTTVRLEIVNEGLVHFYQTEEPLSLCEMATPVFKFYQDVRLVLSIYQDVRILGGS